MNMQFCSQPGFASAYGYPQGQRDAMAYPDAHAQFSLHHPSYTGFQYMYGYPTHRTALVADRGGMCDGKTESKPRLSKDEVEKLEKVFQENSKPSSSVKAQLADALGLERPRINNWFQNRRAKAKQERKQEEYEARRAAEKDGSEPLSPADSLTTPDSMSESSQRRKPSTAAFPRVSSPSHLTDSANEDEEDEDDGEEEEEDEHRVNAMPHSADSASVSSSVSAHAEPSDIYRSPHAFSLPSIQNHSFSQLSAARGFLQSRSMSDFGLINSPLHQGASFLSEQPSDISESILRPERSMSSECLDPQSYARALGARYQNASTSPMFFQPMANGDSDGCASPFDENASPDYNGSEHSSHTMAQGMPTPTDSFRSPPPPANIASRRNIPRPAALQAASLRSRSYNLGGIPKTAFDGPKRMDTSSLISSMRRISSATGTGPGRIQKCVSGPRSPLVFGRSAEALLQYHTRSPVCSGTPTYSGAAPPTPMTPALFEQQNAQEPNVISSCSDDPSFGLGDGIRPAFLQELKEDELKTPPTTPGLMNHYNTTGFVGSSFQSGFSLGVDQPLLTPFFQSELPDMSIQNVPSYVDSSDGLPSTPIYTGVGLEQSAFAGNGISTQFDWDANESVVSSKSSPGLMRSKSIQFTQNITPLDYH